VHWLLEIPVFLLSVWILFPAVRICWKSLLDSFDGQISRERNFRNHFSARAPPTHKQRLSKLQLKSQRWQTMHLTWNKRHCKPQFRLHDMHQMHLQPVSRNDVQSWRVHFDGTDFKGLARSHERLKRRDDQNSRPYSVFRLYSLWHLRLKRLKRLGLQNMRELKIGHKDDFEQAVLKPPPPLSSTHCVYL